MRIRVMVEVKKDLYFNVKEDLKKLYDSNEDDLGMGCYIEESKIVDGIKCDIVCFNSVDSEYFNMCSVRSLINYLEDKKGFKYSNRMILIYKEGYNVDIKEMKSNEWVKRVNVENGVFNKNNKVVNMELNGNSMCGICGECEGLEIYENMIELLDIRYKIIGGMRKCI